MSTGPEHYREAERLLSGLTTDRGAVYVDDGNEQVIAVAQVHANLAQAAAIAMAQPVVGIADESGYDQGDFDDWYAAVNGLPPETRKPAEEYPGELDHLRDLLRTLGKTAESTPGVNDILIDHYSDARIVDATAEAGESR